jgi:hypothetical protein
MPRNLQRIHNLIRQSEIRTHSEPVISLETHSPQYLGRLAVGRPGRWKEKLPGAGRAPRVGSCSSHRSTRLSSAFSSTRATCQGVVMPRIVSNSLVSYIRSLLKAFYQQNTSNSTRRRSGPPSTCGARAGGLTNYPNPCDPRNSGRTRS